MHPTNPAQLFVVALFGVALLLFLIIGRKLHAFVALLLVSLVLGLGAQWPDLNPDEVLDSMQRGMGGTLGFVAVVVGLGAMFGQLLDTSGATRVLATGLLRVVGMERAPWALVATGFLISIPVFFDVAFVILVPMLHALSRRTGKPVMGFALPLLAGMVVTHSFVPPTPGPVGVATLLGADLGLVMGFGLLAGGASAIVAGPLFARLIGNRVVGASALIGSGEQSTAPVIGDSKPSRIEPSLGTVLGLMALPMVLIVGNTALGAWVSEPGPSLQLLRALGHPFVALLLTTLSCFWVLGTRRGSSRAELNQLATRALEPAGIIILVTGAGGVLKQVLVDTGVGKALAEQMLGLGLGPLVMGFLIAWVVRVMQGSATVSMLTAAGLVVPSFGVDVSDVDRALCVIAIAAGATCTSIVNDSGFWLVSRYLGLSVPQTLRTWSVMTSIVGLVGFAVVLVLHHLLSQP